jgi:hypothetical protein
METSRKRLIIFSPELHTQEWIRSRVLDNLQDIFKVYPGEIQVQEFYSIGESIDKGSKIGRGDELFVVFDNYLLPRDKRRNYFFNPMTSNEHLQFRALRALEDITKKICDEDLGRVPYITYNGEMQKPGGEMNFRKKLQNIKPNILKKLIGSNELELASETIIPQ